MTGCAIASIRPTISTLSQRCAMIALSRCLNDPNSRRIALGIDVQRMTAHLANVSEKLGLFQALREQEVAGKRALWLRTTAQDIGHKQLVVVPCGLDTTAYDERVATGKTVFEVDHPSVITLKKFLIETRGGISSPAASINYIPHSPYNSDRWVHSLVSADAYDHSSNTIWIIPDRAIEDFGNGPSQQRDVILRSPLIYSPSGSAVVFRIDRKILNGLGIQSPTNWLKSIGYKYVELTESHNEIGVVAFT